MALAQQPVARRAGHLPAPATGSSPRLTAQSLLVYRGSRDRVQQLPKACQSLTSPDAPPALEGEGAVSPRRRCRIG